MKWIILVYLIINPLFFIPGVVQRDAQQICFQLSSVLVFACGMFFRNKEIKLDKLNISIGALLISFILAWLISLNGWIIALNLLLGIMVYLTIIKTLNKNDIEFIFKGIGWICALCLGYMILQYFGYDIRGTINVGKHTRIDTNSIFFHKGAMGMYFAQSLPLITSFSWVGALLLLPLRLSECSSALFGGIVGLQFFLWFRKRIMFWVLLIPLLAGGIFYTLNQEAYYGVKIRIPLWKLVLTDISRRPLGRGLDSFANPPKVGQWRYYSKIKSGDSFRVIKGKDKKWYPEDKLNRDDVNHLTYADHPHNEYLWLGYEVGIQGLIIFGFIVYFLWKRFMRSDKNRFAVVSMASILTIGIICLTQFVFHLARLGHMFPVILGIFYVATDN